MVGLKAPKRYVRRDVDVESAFSDGLVDWSQYSGSDLSRSALRSYLAPGVHHIANRKQNPLLRPKYAVMTLLLSCLGPASLPASQLFSTKKASLCVD